MENNEQYLTDRGVRAEELLHNETFQSVIKELVDYSLNAFLASKPEDEKLRQAAYYQANAAQGIVGVLHQWVAIKEQIIAQREDEV